MTSRASTTTPRRAGHRAVGHLIMDKSQIVRWTRDELEDKYLRLCDDHLQTKIQLKEKDDLIKKQQAQLVKSRKGQGEQSVSPNREDNATSMQNRLMEFERENTLLKDKLKSANYQLRAYAQFPLSPYYHHRSRPNSSMSLRPPQPRTDREVTLSLPLVPHGGGATATSSEMTQQLQEKILHLETTNFQMQEQKYQIQEQNKIYEVEISSLKEELKKKQNEFISEYDRLKIQVTSDQKYTVQENIEIIRLQKMLREKSNEFALLQAKFNKVEMDLRSLKTNHDHVMMELDQCNIKVRTEQTLNAQLQNELRMIQSENSGNLVQLKQEVETLKRENEILEESAKRLTASAFNTEREKQWEVTEKSLRSQIVQFESAIKADVNIRGELLEKLAQEIGSKDELDQQIRKLEVINLQQKAEMERIQQKLDKVTLGQTVQYEELIEVLSIVRQRKQVTITNGYTKMPDGLLQLPVDRKPAQNFEEQLHNLELAYAEAVQELEKTRNMLLIQHKINRDYQLEVDEVSRNAEQNKSNYERKLKEYAQMLDQRAMRIQRLEKQLHDIAYGTRPYKTVPGIEPSDSDLALESGQNLLELHITKITLTDQALRYMQSVEPTNFLTIEFFDFEIQFTPMVRGAGPQMDFTCQYTVTVTDFFLHYLQTEFLFMELHQAIATQYKTWAAGNVDLRELLTKPQAKIQGSVHLLGTSSESVGILFGQIEFSLQLLVPVEQALRLYKERTKALGYVLQDKGPRPEDAQENITNQLHIYVHRCHNLISQIGGTVPSAYAVYQFFDFPDHDTAIVQENANPEFADHMSFPVIMNRASDQFLRSQSLRIYVFDDAAPTDDLSYTGHTDVPLILLAHNKPIMGSFELRTVGNNVSGTIDVSLNWQFAYVTTPDAMFIAEPLINLPLEAAIEMPPTDGELDEVPVHLVQAKRKPNGFPIPSEKVVGPLATDADLVEDEERLVIRIDRLVTPAVPINEINVARPVEPPVKEPSLKDASIKEPSPKDTPVKEPSLKDLSVKEPSLKDTSVKEPSPKDTPVKEPSLPSLKETSIKEASPKDVPVKEPSFLDKPVKESSLPGLPPLIGSQLKRIIEGRDVDADSISSGGSSQKSSHKESESESKKVSARLPPPAAPRKSHPPAKQAEEKKGGSREGSVQGEAEVPDSTRKGSVYVWPIVIGINSLWLPEESPLLKDEKVSKLFIEWRFLDLQPEDSETPQSLPKPAEAGHKINFNYSQKIEMTTERQKLLQDMLTSGESMIFELVSDPGDQGDCEELGTASVSLADLAKKGKDLENEMIDVFDENAKLIAIIHVSLKINDAVKSLPKSD